MLRSDDVEAVSLYFSADSIRNTLERLGNLSAIHFVGEANKELEQESTNLDQLEQKLEYFKNELKSHEIRIETSKNCPDTPFPIVETEIAKYHEQLSFLKQSWKENRKVEEILEQNLKIIKFSRRFVSDLQKSEKMEVIDFDFVTAIASTDKKIMIRKMLKHRMRRNIYIRSCDVEPKASAKRQTIFIVYVLGEENKAFARNIINSLGGRVFDFVTKDVLIYSQIEERYGRYRKLNRSIKKQICQAIDGIETQFPTWKYIVNKERAVLEAMKKLKKIENAGCFIGEGWALKKDMKKLEKMKSFDTEKGRFLFEIKKSNLVQPTHFDPSEFAKAFQNLTNVFGVPKYKEINPAIFMIFTFPFLFGAMFGDIFHGLILLFISLYLIRNQRRLDGKCGVFQIILDGRFVVFSCSLFAIWFGFLYGDFGSLPISLFQSQYEIGRTYPFGIDPIWHHAANKMVFINSIKMKLSLIIGFFHMGLGSAISITNGLYFKDSLGLVCQIIPQAITFTLFLGYLVFLCLYKWLVTVDHPSLVNTLISMYTDPFNNKNQMYPGQIHVQVFIFSIILICIPWMILSKPIYLTIKKRVPEAGTLDLWITSGIHAVEFYLGLISNTSSYLRLWAVSLAHVQLTSVLHEFTLGSASTTVRILTFPIYFCGTLLLLIGLEGLSSCLHALRLNWIEFFSKFYSGGGTLFEPLTFDINEIDD